MERPALNSVLLKANAKEKNKFSCTAKDFKAFS